MTTDLQPAACRALGGCILAAAMLAGCAGQNGGTGVATGVTVSDKAHFSRTGFLSDYGRLQPVTWSDGMECWREPNLDAKQYDRVLVSRIVVSLAPAKGDGAQNTVDPSDLKTLTDYFHDSMVRALRPRIQVVDKPGPGVVVMRIAVTDLSPTRVSESVAGTLIPYAFIAEAGAGVATGRPAGSTPYMGEAGMEMQFRDGVSGAILAECRDAQIGRKYAADLNAGAAGAVEVWANGYLSSFQSWSYAKLAFDKWSLLIAQRIAELRGVGAAAP